jgi:hypothetical protein
MFELIYKRQNLKWADGCTDSTDFHGFGVGTNGKIRENLVKIR